MKKPLRIISIDGTRGSGKTSQIRMLSKYIKSLGFVYSDIQYGDSVQSATLAIKFVESFLENPLNPNGFVIIDGSIARPMVTDLIEGVPTSKVMDEYKSAIHDYERLDQKYGMVGLLLVMDDVGELNDRLVKREALSGTKEVEVLDIGKEPDIVNGMRTFNNHVISRNIKFHTFNLEPVDSMMEINKEIIKYLNEH